jgi:glycosyltransferase involved in cell wall biosynthesis
MLKIFYWSPFLSKIATVSSITRSIESIKKYNKKDLDISIIDSVGEWDGVKDKIPDIKTIKLYKNSFYNRLPKKGFLQSRLTLLFIYFFSFFKLLNLLKNKKPDFIIVHLLVSLPLILMTFLNGNTKLILRISGLPKLNIIRKTYWKFFSKNIFKVTCPSIATYEKLKLLKIFKDSQLEILYDPIISTNEIIKKSNLNIEERFKNKKFIIGIGRLTKQKNFKLLIKAFKKIHDYEKNLNLIILGEGEKIDSLKILTDNLGLTNFVYFLGYKKNIYSYLKKAECFILSSLWEDPGFVLIESSFMNIPIIASDCPNGPQEIINKDERGYLFKNNSVDDLLKKYMEFKNSSKYDINKKIYKAKIYSKNYTMFNHYLKLKKILNLDN